MSHSPIIDSVAFARAGSVCHGTLEGRELTRLSDRLVDSPGSSAEDRSEHGLEDRTGNDRTSNDRTSNDRTSNDRTGNDRTGNVSYEVRGMLWDDKPSLELRVDGWLMVRCQRCLGAMRWPVQIENRVRLARNDADLDLADEEGVDAIAASQELSVAELVEDELLLQWPIAPRHDVHGMRVCDEAVGRSSRAALDNPFAVLKELSSPGGGTEQGSKD